MSPFGIAHEPLSKSYGKIAARLRSVAVNEPWGPTLNQRMKQNYVVARIQRGEDKNPVKNKYYKEFGDASYKGYQNSRETKRVLP